MSHLTQICNSLKVPNIENHQKPSKPTVKRIINNFKIIVKSLSKSDRKLLLKKYQQKLMVLSP